MINLDFVDKIKTKFQKKSIDQEIDEAFDGSYSKKVLDGSDKYPRGDDQLSGDYRQEAQREAPRALVEPDMQNGLSSDQQKVGFLDPLQSPEGIDRQLPKPDAPLQVSDERTSSNEDRREFFGASPPMAARSELSSADVGAVMLEIKDLRTQNEHIIDLLKNIQDRLRRY